MKEMVPTEDGRHILAIYGQYVKVLNKVMRETLPQYWPIGHAIDSDSGYNLALRWTCNLSQFSCVEWSGIAAIAWNKIIHLDFQILCHMDESMTGYKLIIDKMSPDGSCECNK